MKMRLLLAAAALATGLISGAQGALAASAAPARPAASSPFALTGVSCVGNSLCVALGSQPGKGFVALTEQWNGKTWRIIPNPSGWLNEVLTCGSLTFCLRAVTGPQHKSLLRVWNGRAWRRFGPQPPSGTVSVTCLSPKFCLGAPSGPRTSPGGLELDWTGGSSWRYMPGTGAGCGGAFCKVDALGCGSATVCWDSGTRCGDFHCKSGIFDYTDVWNGTTWSDSTNDGPGFSGPEACAGRSFCLILDAPKLAAVSNDWGMTWQSAATHLAASCRVAKCDPGGSAFPSCGSPHFCMAMPSGNSTGILIWNGTKWGVSKLAQIGGHLPKVNDLACGSPTNCMVSGSYQPNPHTAPKPVAEHWNGKTWKVTPIKKP
jgi:hypothetical protein